MTGLEIKTIKKLLVTSILTSTLVIAGCGENAQPEQDASKHVERGASYLERGQFKAAMIEARNALQKAPTEVDSNLLMADILLEMGQYKVALEQLETIGEQNASAEYLLTKAETYNQMRKFRSADKLLNQHKTTLMAFDAKRYLELAGNAKLGLNEIEDARSLYDELLQLDANSANTLTLQARLAAVEGNTQQAQKLIEDALAIDESFTDALLLKANILFQSKDMAGAEDALTQALTGLTSTDIITPTRATILRNLAQILTLQGRSSEALVYTRLLADALPGSDIARDKLQEAVESYKAKDLDAAKQQLTALLEEYPNYEQASQLLAIINFLQGNLEAANEYFSEGLDPEQASDQLNQIAALTGLRLNQPQQVVTMLEEEAATTDNPNILALYGIAALSSDTPKKGEAALIKAIDIDPKPQLRLSLAQFYNQQVPPQPEKALDQLQKALNEKNDQPVLQNALVGQLLRMNKTGEAAKTINQVLEQYPNNDASHLLAGKFYLSQEKIDKAFTAFKQADSLNPNQPDTLLNIARLHIAQKNYDSADKLFRQVIAIAPENPIAYKGLITLGELKSQPESGLEELSQLALSQAENITPLLVQGEYYLRNNKLDKAAEVAKQALDKAANDPRAKQFAGVLAYREALVALGDKSYDAARTASLKGLQHTPNALPLLSTLADAEINSANHGEARKLIEQIQGQNPQLAHHLQGNLYMHQTPVAIDLALKEYQQAWQLKPDDALGLKIYSLLGSTQQIAQRDIFLQSWLNAIPTSEQAYFALSNQHIARENYQQAIPILEKLTANRPNNALYWNNLAWGYLQINHPKAEESAFKASQLAPDNAAVLDTYGWVLFKAGHQDKALTVLKQALSIAPDNDEIQKHLDAVIKAQ